MGVGGGREGAGCGGVCVGGGGGGGAGLSLAAPRGVRVRVQDGTVWKSRWLSWASRPNEPYGFCRR